MPLAPKAEEGRGGCEKPGECTNLYPDSEWELRVVMPRTDA